MPIDNFLFERTALREDSRFADVSRALRRFYWSFTSTIHIPDITLKDFRRYFATLQVDEEQYLEMDIKIIDKVLIPNSMLLKLYAEVAHVLSCQNRQRISMIYEKERTRQRVGIFFRGRFSGAFCNMANIFTSRCPNRFGVGAIDSPDLFEQVLDQLYIPEVSEKIFTLDISMIRRQKMVIFGVLKVFISNFTFWDHFLIF